MTQGRHHAYVRLAVTYNGVQYFSPTTTLDFTRSGTTWNIAAVILVGGAGKYPLRIHPGDPDAIARRTRVNSASTKT